jgi:hypothetical protein
MVTCGLPWKGSEAHGSTQRHTEYSLSLYEKACIRGERAASWLALDYGALIVEIGRLADAGLTDREIAARVRWHVVDVRRALGDRA